MGGCICCQSPVIDTHATKGALEVQYPRDALQTNPVVEESIEQLKDHVFLTHLDVNLTFLDKCDGASDDALKQTLVRLAEALYSCNSLRHLGINIYIPSADHGGDPGGTVGCVALHCDCFALTQGRRKAAKYLRAVPPLPKGFSTRRFPKVS